MDDRWHNDLDHATTGIGAEFSSGFLGDFVGVDVGAFSATDLWSSDRPYHEIAFFPARDPWSIDPDARYPENGVSPHKALIKFRHNETWWGKAGYFQPTGPGVLGANWSVYMQYTNSTDLADWQGFKNAFQDEHDFMLIITVPFNF